MHWGAGEASAPRDPVPSMPVAAERDEEAQKFETAAERLMEIEVARLEAELKDTREQLRDLRNLHERQQAELAGERLRRQREAVDADARLQQARLDANRADVERGMARALGETPSSGSGAVRQPPLPGRPSIVRHDPNVTIEEVGSFTASVRGTVANVGSAAARSNVVVELFSASSVVATEEIPLTVEPDGRKSYSTSLDLQGLGPFRVETRWSRG